MQINKYLLNTTIVLNIILKSKQILMLWWKKYLFKPKKFGKMS